MEGSGTVVENGGGLMGWRLVGKRVAVLGHGQWGTWAEYCVVSAAACIAIPDDVSFN